jgi:hypothetical protein
VSDRRARPSTTGCHLTVELVEPLHFLRRARGRLHAAFVDVVAIEICIDVGNHIIAGEGYRAPRDYGDVFGCGSRGRARLLWRADGTMVSEG